MTARVEAMPPARRELAQALTVWAATARREAGALDCRVYEDLELPAVFEMMSFWETDAALDAHLRGATFGSVLGAVELLARPPRISVSETGEPFGRDGFKGLSWLRERRRGIMARRAASREPVKTLG